MNTKQIYLHSTITGTLTIGMNTKQNISKQYYHWTIGMNTKQIYLHSTITGHWYEYKTNISTQYYHWTIGMNTKQIYLHSTITGTLV